MAMLMVDSCSDAEDGGALRLGAASSRVLAEDRDRHRRELDTAWRKERATAARVTEWRSRAEELRKRDAELRLQLCAIREYGERQSIERQGAEAAAALNARLATAAMALAVELSRRPPEPRAPVRDSELLRAVRRAENRALKLERALASQSSDVGRATTAPGRTRGHHAPGRRPNDRTHGGDDGDDDLGPVNARNRFPVADATLDELIDDETANPSAPFRPLVLR
jgi:hypothetical protein